MTQNRPRTPALTPERRRLVLSLGVAAVVIGIGVAGIALALGDGATRTAGPAGTGEFGWTQLPDPPLSARQGSTAMAVGHVILIVGGDDAPPCPPNADCAAPAHPLADGAAWDATTRTWHSIAPAPVPIGTAQAAVIDNTAYLWVPSVAAAAPSFLAYDAVEDAWDVLPIPPNLPKASVRLVATSSSIIAYLPTHELGDRVDQVFSIATETWSPLPGDPLTPSFDRTIVAAGERVVAIGVELVPNPGQRPPVYRAAILDPATGTWRRLADAPIVGNDATWFVAGSRIINPTLGGADGGQTNNWGRVFPFGGMLDLEGEAWVVLPQPAGSGSFGGPPAAGAGYVVSREGWALNVEELAWVLVGRPDGGPESGGAAAWADGNLVLFGGVRFGGNGGNGGTLIGGAWEWLPPEP